jgi:hypothetical protein
MSIYHSRKHEAPFPGLQLCVTRHITCSLAIRVAGSYLLVVSSDEIDFQFTVLSPHLQNRETIARRIGVATLSISYNT